MNTNKCLNTVSIKKDDLTSLIQHVFPDTWKMANIIPAHKKEEKYLVKNSRPISLLPILAKFLKELYLIFSSLIFIITIYLPDVDLVSCQVTLVHPNVFPLIII